MDNRYHAAFRTPEPNLVDESIKGRTNNCVQYSRGIGPGGKYTPRKFSSPNHF